MSFHTRICKVRLPDEKPLIQIMEVFRVRQSNYVFLEASFLFVVVVVCSCPFWFFCLIVFGDLFLWFIFCFCVGVRICFLFVICLSFGMFTCCVGVLAVDVGRVSDDVAVVQAYFRDQAQIRTTSWLKSKLSTGHWKATGPVAMIRKLRSNFKIRGIHSSEKRGFWS